MRPEPARDARARASMGYFLRCGLLAGLAAGRLEGFAAGFDLVVASRPADVAGFQVSRIAHSVS